MNNYEKVYKIVKSIPKGKVSTYGVIARIAGISNPRQVGYALHHNPDPVSIPCHRVVNSKGNLAPNFAFGGAEIQAELLANEGVVVINNKVDLAKYLGTNRQNH